MDFDFNVRVWNANLDHRMRSEMAVSRVCAQDLICFTMFAQIEIRADSAFVADTADAELVVFAGFSITMSVAMDYIHSWKEMFDRVRQMVEYFCKYMIWMNGRGSLKASVAEVVIQTLETFVSHSDNVLRSI